MYPQKNKRFLLLLISLLTIFALAAAQCGGPATGGAQPAPVKEEAKAKEEAKPAGELAGLKIAMLTSGPINDDGWNQTAYEGLLALQEAGAEIANTENVAQADQLDLIRSYADQGFTVIVGHGFEYGDALLTAAEEYPDLSFIQIGGIAANGKNIASFVFRPGEAGYIAGIVAGLMTKSNKIGGVGAVEIPTIAADYTAYATAAKTVNPNISDVPVAYTGSWVDIPKAKEAAIAQIDSGIYAIGMTRDQNHLSPDLVLTSNVQRIDHILMTAVSQIQDGSIKWANTVVGMAEGAQQMTPLIDSVPAEVKAEVEAVTQAIVDGSIVLDDAGNVVKDDYHK